MTCACGTLLANRCTAKPWVTRVAACALGCVSFLIVWSEATIASGTNPDLSPFSHVRRPPLSSLSMISSKQASTTLLRDLPFRQEPWLLGVCSWPDLPKDAAVSGNCRTHAKGFRIRAKA